MCEIETRHCVAADDFSRRNRRWPVSEVAQAVGTSDALVYAAAWRAGDPFPGTTYAGSNRSGPFRRTNQGSGQGRHYVVNDCDGDHERVESLSTVLEWGLIAMIVDLPPHGITGNVEDRGVVETKYVRTHLNPEQINKWLDRILYGPFGCPR
jgi:hypothetical protein